MENTLALIEQIIEEHRQIFQSLDMLERETNDLSAIAQLQEGSTKSYFVPSSLSDQGKGLEQWQRTIKTVETGIDRHFRREETALMAAVEQQADNELESGFRALLDEHGDLRRRVAKLRQDAADMASGGPRIDVWEKDGWGMRVNLEQLKKRIEAHAAGEMELLTKFRDALRKAAGS
ncbi:MAG: hemerythrin domain-containing protein [Chloroflexota bacterium]